MSDAELKPCPFCGSDHIYAVNDYDKMAHHVVIPIEWAIGCSNCRFAEVTAEDIDLEKGKQKAIEAWNKRADAPMLAEQVTGLKEGLYHAKEANKILAEQNEKMLAMLKYVSIHSHEFADRDDSCKCPLCKLGRKIAPLIDEVEG